MRIEYHRTLIADTRRNRALRDALARVIRPGETVLADIGAGTGLLGLMAWRLGAREVHLYEANADMARVTADVLKVNRARGCHLYPCRSTDMIDPPHVDVIISETLGNYALEEDIIATLNDARRRMLKPGGIVIPSRIRQFACPVTSARIADDLNAWSRVGSDLGLALDLSAARTLSHNNVYVRTLRAQELLDGGRAARKWDDVDLTRQAASARKGEMTWTFTAGCSVHGFAYWWEANLAGEVTLSTSPIVPPTHWEQLYFPLPKTIDAKRGESVLLSLRSRSSHDAGTHLAWTAIHRDTQGNVLSRQAQDLDKGWVG